MIICIHTCPTSVGLTQACPNYSHMHMHYFTSYTMYVVPLNKFEPFFLLILVYTRLVG